MNKQTLTKHTIKETFNVQKCTNMQTSNQTLKKHRIKQTFSVQKCTNVQTNNQTWQQWNVQTNVQKRKNKQMYKDV